MKYILAGLLMCLSLAQSIQASHLAGAAVTCETLAPDTVRIYQTTWYYCSGAAPTNTWLTTPAGVGSSCNVPVPVGAVVFMPVVEITPVCPSMQTTCTNSAAVIEGYTEQVGYQDYVISGLNCPEYTFTYESCCRIPNLTSIVSPSNINIVAQSQFSLGAMTSGNHFPVWNTAPNILVWNSGSATFDHGATDQDGDSLAYSLTYNWANASGGSVTYNPGYGVTSPMGPNWQVHLDTNNGWLTLNPNPASAELAIAAIEVQEFRNGNLLSTNRRDVPLYVINQSLNLGTGGPTHTGLSAPNGSAVVVGDTVVVPLNSSACFQISAGDPDPGDSTTLNALLVGNPILWQFTDTSGGAAPVKNVSPVGEFCVTTSSWATVPVYAQASPDLCFYNGFTPYSYTLMVGDTGLVWPGDANDDLIANNLDFLALGLGFGGSGSLRSGANLSWIGQFAFPWQDTIPGGIDLKHVDTDGSGLVDADDTLAILQNYGFTHNKTGSVSGTATDPPLTLQFGQDSVNVGDTLHVPIFLGDLTVQAQNVYGIAFTVNYDPALIDSGSFFITYDNNWMGTNALSMDYDFYNQGRCDGAYTLTNQQAVTGAGQIGTAHFIIIDNIDGKRNTLIADTLELGFTNVTLIGVDGVAIPVQASGDQVTVIDASTELTPEKEVDLQVFPNPAHQSFSVRVAGQSSLQVEMIDLQGRTLFQSDTLGDHLRISLQDTPTGWYFVRVSGAFGTVVRRVVVQ